MNIVKGYFLIGVLIVFQVSCSEIEEKKLDSKSKTEVTNSTNQETDSTYQNGQKKFKGNKINGQYVEYWWNGQVKIDVNYSDGKENGDLISYYDNGNIQSQGKFVNGIKDGEYISYHENGNIEFKVNFINGKEEGEGISYYDSGEIQDKVNYSNGHRKGDLILYYKDGRVKRIDEVDDENNYFKNKVSYE